MSKSKKKGKVLRHKQVDSSKLCTFCYKPIKKKGHLCGKCVSMMAKINQNREDVPSTEKGGMIKGVAYKISQNKVKFIMDHVIKSHDPDIVIRWFNELHFYDWFTYIPLGSKIARQYKKNIREMNRENVNEEKKIPNDVCISVELPFILIEFKKQIHYNQELVKVTGTYAYPIVIVKCKSCEQEYACKFNDFKNGKFEHRCSATISSGELLVETWLKSKNEPFKTQFNTYKVINPHTNHQLPFDFELSNRKIIIEVHGEQHYKFIPMFHQTIENFQYQQWKDNYKKEQAEQNGYHFIEINYDQIKNSSYIEVLTKEISVCENTDL